MVERKKKKKKKNLNLNWILNLGEGLNACSGDLGFNKKKLGSLQVVSERYLFQ